MAVKGLKVNSLNMSDDVPGLVLLNTTSFSGVASQSIGSDAAPLFTSAYKNYKVIFSGESSSSSQPLFIRMRTNVTDDTTNNYIYLVTYRTNASGTTDFSATQTGFYLGNVSSTLRSHAIVDFQYPQVADYTTMTGLSVGFVSTANTEFYTLGGFKNTTTQYNGMTIYPSTGTITGEVSVYGYNA